MQAISLEATSRPAAVPHRAPSAAAREAPRVKPAGPKAPPKTPPKKLPTVVAHPHPASSSLEDPALEEKATEIVRSYYGWSAAAGLVPVPWLDFAAVVGVQVRMVEELAKLYGRSFDKHTVRPLVVALLSATGGCLLAGPMALLLRGVPVVGSLASLLTLPAMATASCWATGQVFIRHFESGGTLHDFDPAQASVAAKGAA